MEITSYFLYQNGRQLQVNAVSITSIVIPYQLSLQLVLIAFFTFKDYLGR